MPDGSFWQGCRPGTGGAAAGGLPCSGSACRDGVYHVTAGPGRRHRRGDRRSRRPQPLKRFSGIKFLIPWKIKESSQQIFRKEFIACLLLISWSSRAGNRLPTSPPRYAEGPEYAEEQGDQPVLPQKRGVCTAVRTATPRSLTPHCVRSPVSV